jgi:ABC-type sugar transport system ATPase subunit
MSTYALELRDLHKRYGKNEVLRGVNLQVTPGEFMVVYGLPVSGKSVLVRLLTGLEKPDAGQIILRGQDITHAAPGSRNIGYVPQSFALYPHMNVDRNIGYPLDLAKTPRAERDAEVKRVAELLDIAELLDRMPDQLSGGQKQRVAIARGLVKPTDVYILDDPLIGLDFKLRERLIDDLKRTQEVLGVTFVYMTSDAVESMMLASEIAVLAAGEIVEVAAPERLYEAPRRAESMQYVGFPQANFLRGTLVKNGAGYRLQTLAFETPVTADEGIHLADMTQEVTVGLRPEHIRIDTDFPPGMLTQPASVLLREDLGGEDIIYLDVNGRQLATVLRNDDTSQAHAEIDEQITIGVDPTALIVFADNRRVARGAPA